MIILKYVSFSIFFLCIFFPGKPTIAIELTDAERAWLADHQEIRLGVDPEFAPFEFVTDEGNYRGIAADFIKLINQRLGLEMKPVIGLTWKQVLEKAKQREIDVLPIVGITEERKKFFNYSKSYVGFPRVIITRVDSTVGSLDDLKGLRVAVQANSSHHGFLKEMTDLQPALYDTFKEAMLALSRGDNDAVIGNLAVATHLMQDLSLTNLKIATHVSPQPFPLAFAIRKDWPELVTILNKTINSISYAEKRAILQKWVPVQISQEQPSKVALTKAEKSWLASHPEVTIAFDGDYAPYSFKNEKGGFKGIAVDFARELADRVGLNLKVYPEGTWKRLYAAALERDVDVIATLVLRPLRKKRFEFTRPYISLAQYIITRKGSDAINTREQIAGKTVALVEKYSTTRYLLEEFPTVKPYYVDNLTAALEAVSTGKAQATVAGMGMAHHLIAQHGFLNLQFAALFAQGLSEQRFGVRKDWPELASILDKTLISMGEDKRLQIFQRWSSPEIAQVETFREPSKTIEITKTERVWLDAHPVIRVAADRDFAPVEFLDDGKFKGVSVDYLKRISEMLGVEFQIKEDITWQQAVDMVREGQLDMFSAAMKTLERETFATFTQPYLSLPVVVFTRFDAPYISELKELTGRKIAVVQGYAIAEFLKKNYPQVEIIEVRNIPEGLKLVESREVFAYLGSLLITSHYIREMSYTNLKVSGETGFKLDLAMGIRSDWPLLTGLLQKALDTIDKKERSEILRNWLGVTYEKRVEYSFIWKIALGVGLVLAIFIFWNLSLSRQVTRRRQAEYTAKDSEQRLSQIVDFLPDPTFVIDLQGKVQAWNRALEKMTGTKPEAILGKGNYEYAQAFYGERRPVLADLALKWDDDVAKKYDTVTKMGDALFIETFVPHLGEKGIHTWSIASLIRNANGDVIGAIESIRDITDRREIEALHERYEFIVNTIRDPMSFIRADYVYEAVNDAWCDGLQTNKEKSIGKTVAEIWGTELFENELRPNLERCFAGQTVFFESGLDLPSIGTRFVRTTMYPFFNKLQEISHVALVSRDITERKEAEEAQKRRIDELAQARRAMLSMMEDLEEAKKEAEEHSSGLEKEVRIRKEAEEELQDNIETLERFRKMAVGREKQMIKLKEEINELLSETGRPEKYKIVG